MVEIISGYFLSMILITDEIKIQIKNKGDGVFEEIQSV